MSGSEGAGLGSLAFGALELIQFGCSRSAELAFSLPALPLAELQPPPPITEVRTPVTASAAPLRNPEGLPSVPSLDGRASCLAGMFVEGIQVFKELSVLSDFVWFC